MLIQGFPQPSGDIRHSQKPETVRIVNVRTFSDDMQYLRRGYCHWPAAQKEFPRVSPELTIHAL